MMRIPNKFKLLGHTINVVMEDCLVDEADIVGQARYRKNEIAIQRNNGAINRPQSNIEQTFLHELVHMILSQMNEDEDGRDEKYVDGFAGLLHQAFTTMEYE